MAKKKKGKSFESILERAEKLFHKGNYPLAKKEFEKAGKMLEKKGVDLKRKDIAKKIEICRKEAKRLKADDLLKRAKKYSGKRNHREAIRCFEKAYEILGEDWIREKIGRLREISFNRDLVKAARNAKATGQYLQAVELYDQALVTQKREDLLVEKAHCLIKAEKYKEGITLLKGLILSDRWAMYDYGFALAKVGRYYESLKVWDSIESQANNFLKQRETVRSMLAADLYERFDRVKDFTRIYEEGRYLLNCTGWKDLDGLIEYCKYAWIEELWREEQYEAIAELLLDSPPKMGHAMLALRAKLSFKLTEISGEHLSDFTMFWLTSVYNEMYGGLRGEVTNENRVCQKLIEMAEDLIKKQADASNKSSERHLNWWNIEKKLIEDLHRLVGDRGDLAHLVCTPRFAAHFGKSDQVLQLIRDNREFFKDREHYLMTGSYYSSAGQGLYYIEDGKYEKALLSLPMEKNGDEFMDYGVKRVNFAYGLYYLEQGGSRPEQFFREVVDLFHISPRYEKEFIEKALDAYEPDELHRYEVVLTEIYKNNSSERIKEALSLVLSRRAVSMYNRHLMNLKSLQVRIEKALKLNPENEHARGILNDSKANWELKELGNALSRHKMNKACKIASESEHHDVRKYFFAFFERSIRRLDQMGLRDGEKIRLLNEFYEWCLRVDDSHYILDDINNLLEKLE